MVATRVDPDIHHDAKNVGEEDRIIVFPFLLYFVGLLVFANNHFVYYDH